MAEKGRTTPTADEPTSTDSSTTRRATVRTDPTISSIGSMPQVDAAPQFGAQTDSRSSNTSNSAGDGVLTLATETNALTTTPTAMPSYKHLPGHFQDGDGHMRRVYVVRHAERVDRLFPNWLSDAFRGAVYKPFDLNLPHKLPRRPTGEFAGDPPISEMGALMGSLVGRGLKLERAVVTHVFASPALHCVQTAAAIVAGMGADTLICVEPGLFEPLSLHPAGIPQLLTPARLRAFGYPVDLNYVPIKRLTKERSVEQAYARVRQTFEELLAMLPKGGGALLVAHAATLDAVAGCLTHATPTVPSANDLCRLGLRYPFCSTVGGVERGEAEWQLQLNKSLPLSYLDTTNLVVCADAARA